MIVDLSSLPPAVRQGIAKIVSSDFNEKLAGAIENQKRAAHWYSRNPPKWCDGVGEATMKVDPLLHWIARQKYGDAARYPDFWEWVRKKDDAFAVRSVSPKIQVGYRAPSGRIHSVTSGAVRERKAY
jgi:hypothetical protein